MHLAELNVARMRYPADDPRMADFVGNLARVNAVADRMPGFVWRLIGDVPDNALDVRLLADPTLIVNLSVWETAEHLEAFVWKTVHQQIYKRKAEWFDKLESHHFVMWFVEPGHIPSLAEAEARLTHLNAHGNSDFAFDWSHLEHVKLWQSQRCG